MARRSRSRQRRPSASRANPRSYSGLHSRTQHKPPENGAAQSQQQPAAPEQTPEPAHIPNQINWKTEYSKVFSDLKQLLIVSVALFGLMLVVGFFL